MQWFLSLYTYCYRETTYSTHQNFLEEFLFRQIHDYNMNYLIIILSKNKCQKNP